jgi:hypothetical protein
MGSPCVVAMLWGAIALWAGQFVYDNRDRGEQKVPVRLGHTCVQCEVPGMRSKYGR